MYAYPANAAAPIQQPLGYAVVQPQQQIVPQQSQQQYQPQPAGQQPGQQTPNQYYYYYGGEEGQLTDITPTPQMIQQNQVKPPIEGTIPYNETLPSPKLMERALIGEAPTSPALLYNANTNQTYSMPIRNINITTELHIATVFVSMKITFQNTGNRKVNGLFILPCHGTVTSTKANINNGSRYLDTTFIDNESAEQFQPNQRKQRNENESDQPINMYIPNLFRLPIADIAKNDVITIEIDYMQNLEFVQSRYHFHIPLKFGIGILPNDNQNHIAIQCTINCITPGIQYGSTTHQLYLTEQSNLRCKLATQPKGTLTNNRDFHLFYSVQTNAISAALLCDTGNKYEYDPSKSFTCFVNPPTQMEGIFPRDIVFLLDRSGSMTGKPFQDAVASLSFALQTLSEHDRFAIIAFDHEQIMFDPQMENGAQRHDLNQFTLFQAYPNTIERAIQFLHGITARGMTDIQTPLMKSISYLNTHCFANIPFIVLLTDGAVQNEKEIVRDITELNENKTRILTFGIGQYCNEYFLKMLSQSTRGWNEGAVYPNDLYPKIRLMMDKAKTPILTNVELQLPNNVQADIYPKTSPDLFMNGPLVISGKYTGDMPPQVILKGKLQNGGILAIPVRCDVSEIIPIDKIFIKQRMDHFVAEYWLNGDDKIKKQIVDISMNETFPSPYTSMVAYELTPKEKKEQEQDVKSAKAKKKGGGLSGGQIAALAGGAVVIGAGVFLLGNVAATMGNINIMDGLSGGIVDIANAFGSIDCPCDACMDAISCGNFDCGGCANIASCGICGDCDGCLDAIPCGECGGGCGALPGCDAVGDICESCGGVVGGCVDSVGDLCGNICECVPGCIGGIGDLCGNVGDIMGGLCECIGEMGGQIGEIAGGLCDCLGGVVNAVGDL